MNASAYGRMLCFGPSMRSSASKESRSSSSKTERGARDAGARWPGRGPLAKDETASRVAMALGARSSINSLKYPPALHPAPTSRYTK